MQQYLKWEKNKLIEEYTGKSIQNAEEAKNERESHIGNLKGKDKSHLKEQSSFTRPVSL